MRWSRLSLVEVWGQPCLWPLKSKVSHCNAITAPYADPPAWVLLESCGQTLGVHSSQGQITAPSQTHRSSGMTFQLPFRTHFLVHVLPEPAQVFTSCFITFLFEKVIFPPKTLYSPRQFTWETHFWGPDSHHKYHFSKALLKWGSHLLQLKSDPFKLRSLALPFFSLPYYLNVTKAYSWPF